MTLTVDPSIFLVLNKWQFVGQHWHKVQELYAHLFIIYGTCCTWALWAIVTCTFGQVWHGRLWLSWGLCAPNFNLKQLSVVVLQLFIL